MSLDRSDLADRSSESSRQHTLIVCTTCASLGSRSSNADPPPTGGQRLLNRLNQLHSEWHLHDQFRLQPAKCMGVCSRECAIALMCAGKFTYLFGDLPTDETRLETTTAAVLECASQYHAKPDGALVYRDRPELFKTSVVARIPPLL
ncbi:DUF1636 domain-containing protein [Phormidium tenue FACHB-886]|nr:DUF1636 domain-containing protein [Phormidium tenue FACHB-886]